MSTSIFDNDRAGRIFLDAFGRVWLTPPPFDHTKLLVVEGVWALVGSSNWDPRSLRLNSEFDLERRETALTASCRSWR